MKVTVLAENVSNKREIGAEHGLSLYIETANHRILFDMGQSDLFLRNANKLNVDLSQVDIAILSHGHYDHGGGMKAFLQVNSHAPIYLSRYAFGQYYHGTEKYIGLESDLSGQQRLIFVSAPMTIDTGMTLLDCNERVKAEENDAYGLTVYQDGAFVPDLFLHEQYLLIEENGKRILFTGCAHKGILRLMDWLRPDIVIGGFHFKSIAMDDRGMKTLAKAAQELSGYDTDYYTCHCTGVEQYAFLRKKLDRVCYLSSGEILSL